ncbi:hypothetical protein F5144DRAFT_562593, partial [Chaetomium tenue]
LLDGSWVGGPGIQDHTLLGSLFFGILVCFPSGESSHLVFRPTMALGTDGCMVHGTRWQRWHGAYRWREPLSTRQACSGSPGTGKATGFGSCYRTLLAVHIRGRRWEWLGRGAGA